MIGFSSWRLSRSLHCINLVAHDRALQLLEKVYHSILSSHDLIYQRNTGSNTHACEKLRSRDVTERGVKGQFGINDFNVSWSLIFIHTIPRVRFYPFPFFFAGIIVNWIRNACCWYVDKREIIVAD